MQKRIRNFVLMATVAAVAAAYLPLSAQGQAPAQGQGQARPGGPGGQGGGRQGQPPLDPTRAQKIEFTEGNATARYRVREQFVGISFPSDAIGTTQAVTGGLVIRPDGTFDAAQSKIVVDLKSLKSDQAQRDGFIQRTTLETEKFPTLEFVPKRTVGLTWPVPQGTAQVGFQLIGDMTLHGVTKEVTWTVVQTMTNDLVSGSAHITTNFANFNITKPSIGRLMSVGDDITLEIEFRCRRSLL